MAQTTTSRTVSPVALDVRPMAGHIGAELVGIDLARPLADEEVTAIREALLRWKVVFFRDQPITRAQHIAFGGRFGAVTPAHPTLPARDPDYPEILVLDTTGYARGEERTIESRWHTDVTFVPNPPMASILHGVVVPPYGGDTQWTNLAVAYERLSEPIRNLVDALHAVHQNQLSINRGNRTSDYAKQFESKELRAVHPVVRVHPETGERVLFVNPNFTSHIVELSRREGNHLLAMLYEHLASPEFTVRFRWQPDSIAFWDNRATAHLVPTDVPVEFQRVMERITLAGDVPIGPDGATSYALAGETFT